MNYYTWPTLQAFNTWHQTVIDGLNLPRVGVNAHNGEPQPEKQQTLAYTSVTQVSEGDWRAPVEDDVAATYPTGLGTISEAPLALEEEL